MDDAIHDRIAVIGLGRIGLLLALALSKQFEGVVGFDTSMGRVSLLKSGVDTNREIPAEQIISTSLTITHEETSLVDVDVFIITVPTPVHGKTVDLSFLRQATSTAGKNLKLGGLVVIECTVPPGTTEDFCLPLLEESSGLVHGLGQFSIGYSPERVNPGDKEHTLESVVKVIAADYPGTLDRLARIYAPVVPAGIYRAPSIKNAEAAKVVENIQRDVNIAFMNEVALRCHELGLSTLEVLQTASTKWNFLDFRPGLVGGSCVNAAARYFLPSQASDENKDSVILTARKVNDKLPQFLANTLANLLYEHRHVSIAEARVAVLGLSFKEGVADMHNSGAAAVIEELHKLNITPLVHDPRVDANSAKFLYGIRLVEESDLSNLDAVLVAVPHAEYLNAQRLLSGLLPGGIVMDVRGAFSDGGIPANLIYWAL